MSENERQDLETLNEVFEGIGFSSSLNDAKYYKDAFTDERLSTAYENIDNAIREINAVYAELQTKEGR